MKRFITGLTVIIFILSGCATAKPSSSKLAWQNGSQIEVGKPDLLVDTLGNIVSLPKKIILLNLKIDNHKIGPETEQFIRDYIKDNPELMKDTKIRINQFTPVGEFKRLIKNKKISWWWRIFPGIPITMFSLCGRLLGGDHYNPYTDTVNIYSDIPAVALHETGHAVDVTKKVEEGWADYYAVGRLLPPVTLHQEYEASQKAIDYLKEKKERKEENKAYRVLIPAYGTYAGGYTGIPYGDVIGAVVGHVVSILPRYNTKLEYQALDNAIWFDEIVYDIKSDLLAKSLIDDRERIDIEFNKIILTENELQKNLISSFK